MFNAVEDYQANMFLKRILEDPKGFDAVYLVHSLKLTITDFFA
jgi:hypothetical protein